MCVCVGVVNRWWLSLKSVLTLNSRITLLVILFLSYCRRAMCFVFVLCLVLVHFVYTSVLPIPCADIEFETYFTGMFACRVIFFVCVVFCARGVCFCVRIFWR